MVLSIQISHSQLVVVMGFEPLEYDAKDCILYYYNLPPPKHVI